MRTNIASDDKLMAQAMKITGQKTKKAMVEEALRRLVQAERQCKAIRALAGIGWVGDLQEMRGGGKS